MPSATSTSGYGYGMLYALMTCYLITTSRMEGCVTMMEH